MKTESSNPPLPAVLYFETNERDLLLLRMAAAACNVSYAVAGFTDLSAAQSYLIEALSHERPFPDFFLVDYSAWREEGLTLVRWVASEPKMKLIPIIMCSDQQGLAAVQVCYEAGANYFLSKMGSYARLKQMLHTFDACLNKMPVSLQALETLP